MLTNIKNIVHSIEYDTLLSIGVQVGDDRWYQWFNHNEWHDFLLKIIKKTYEHVEWFYPSEVSVLLTDDNYIQELNLTYRGQDKPTNVLSFPTMTRAELKTYQPSNMLLILGDIVLSLETMLKESEKEKKLIVHHITHLVVHGTLHLLGYDHQCDLEAQEMESIEKKVLENLGIADPYQ